MTVIAYRNGIMAAEENEHAEITLSTIHGAIQVVAYQVGPLAVHPMLADDLPLRCDPSNGYAISIASKGYRLSYHGRTFKGAAAAIAFARALCAETTAWELCYQSDWPEQLKEIWKRLQIEAQARGELSNWEITPARIS